MYKRLYSFVIPVVSSLLVIAFFGVAFYPEFKKVSRAEDGLAKAEMLYSEGKIEKAIDTLEFVPVSYDWWLANPKYRSRVKVLTAAFAQKLREQASQESNAAKAENLRGIATFYDGRK